ncbi:MAG: LPS export ABC transporter permease LptF [Methylobacter sp.]|nr:LPS export ABC transporter permease LptF [Methylobacter sp.]
MQLEKSWTQGNQARRRKIVTVIDKLIAQDLLKTLLAVLSVLVVIIVSQGFIRILDKAIQGLISNKTLLSILGFKTIITSVAFLPAAIFMTILMVLGRMYRDQEMSAVFSAGGGPGSIYRAVFLLVFPLSVLAAGLSLYVAPWAESRIAQLMHQDEESSDLRGISAGKFSEYSQGDLVLYVERMDTDKRMHNIFVQNRQHGNVEIINAEAGRMEAFDDANYMILENGERIQGQPGAVNYVIEQFVEYAVRMNTKETVISFAREAVAIDVLVSSKLVTDVAELQRRYSIPVGIMLLSFIAVPLAQISPRGGVYGNMLVGFVIYFSYGNFVRVSQTWVAKEAIPVWVGSYGVNMVLLFIGVVLLARLYGWRWLIIKAREKVVG